MGKVALITGASSGIGKATAERLLAEGYTVYVAARRVENMQDLGEKGAHVIGLDVTKEDELVAAVEQITRENGGVDVLINNAGFGMYGAVEDTTLDDARYQFEVNLFGLARLTQLVLPYMREKKSGTIVNISSIGGKIYTPLGSWYHATKHALEGWSDCLRLELKPFNINVVIIEPGMIETEFGDVMLKPMMERSGSGPYKDMANSFAQMAERAYSKGGGSPASLIADVIAKALRAKRPKTRYAAGKFAGSMLFLRRWLPDRVFDYAVMNAA